jgi:hypothetical protein
LQRPSPGRLAFVSTRPLPRDRVKPAGEPQAQPNHCYGIAAGAVRFPKSSAEIVFLEALVSEDAAGEVEPCLSSPKRCRLVNLPFTPARLHWARKVERIHE